MTMERSSAGTVSLRCRLSCFTILFSDGYINGLIGTAITILTREYPESKFGMQYYSKLLGSVTLAGTVFGMLVFGCTLDRLLRMSFAVSLALLLSMSCGTWGFVFGNSDIAAVVDWLCVWRFLLGIGVGAGNTSATVSVLEQTEKEGIPENAQNWWSVLATNSLIDMGFVTSMFVPFLLSCIFDGKHLNVVWGLSACLSVIPTCLWCHPPKWDDAWEHVHIPYWLALKRYWKSLLGLSLTWFIYDFIMYPVR